MKIKVIVITAAVTFVVALGLFGAMFFIMQQRYAAAASVPAAAGQTAPGYGQGRGPGMMGGRGPGGMMGGQASLPEGVTPPSGGTGGLAATTADGKPLVRPADAPKLADNMAVQKIGSQTVTLAIAPYPPASFQMGTFDVKLVDDKGQPVNDAQVSLNLTMPGMWMPPSAPSAPVAGSGTYRAQAFWTMRGLWLIEVKILRAGATQSAFFTVWL